MPVELRIETHPYHNSISVGARVDLRYEINRYTIDDNPPAEVAREIARRMVRGLEEEITYKVERELRYSGRQRHLAPDDIRGDAAMYFRGGRSLAHEARRTAFEEAHRMLMAPPPRIRRTLEPPKKTKHFKWMSDLKKEITLGEFTAKLLDNSMKVHEEGIEMRHCLHTHYQEKIASAKIIAYHVDVPRDICRSGLTVSFKRTAGDGWEFYQSKGKANSQRQDPRLDDLYAVLLKQLNKNLKTSKGYLENSQVSWA